MENIREKKHATHGTLTETWPVAIPVTLAIVIRIFYFAQVRNSPLFRVPTMDAWYFDGLAQSFARGDILAPAGQTYYQPPFYSFFLSLIYLVFGHNLDVARLIQFAMGGASCLFVCLIARRYFGNWIALLAGIFYATNASLIYYESELLTPSLIILLNLAAIWLLIRYQDNQATWRIALSGLLLGFSATARPDVLLFIPFAAIWLFLILRGTRKLWPVVTFVIVAALPPAMTTIRNLAVSGEFVIVSYNGGLNFYIGNNGNSSWTQLARPTKQDWRWIVTLPAREGVAGGGPAQSSFYYRKALSEYAENPMLLPRLLVKKTLLFWNGREIRRDQDDYYYRQVSSLYAALLWTKGRFGFPFGVLGPLALLGLGLFLPRRRELFLLYGYAATQFLVVIAFFVTSRYRAPVIPILSIFAAAAVFEIGRVLRQRDFTAALGIAAYLVAAVAISLMKSPVVDLDQRLVAAENHYYLGYTKMQLGDDTSAFLDLQKSARLDPNNGWTRELLGEIYLERGQTKYAAREFRAALKADPGVTDARRLLKKMAEQNKSIPP